MPTCPRCAATTAEGDRFCLQCGRPLSVEAAAPDPDATDTALPAVPASAVDLVACPRCGSSNAARRRQCGRCGLVLQADVPEIHPEDDEPQPVAAAWTGRAWEDEQPTGLRRRGVGIGLAVVGLGLVLGTGLGVAAGLGVGPFARVEAVPFDPAAYPQEPVRLRPATAGATSTAADEDGRAFGPERTADGDLTTAWRAEEGDDPTLLRHAFVEPVWVDRIEVATGDQLDAATFARVARVTGAEVDLGTVRVDATIGGVDGVQVLSLPEPVLVDEVTWEVTDTSDGPAAISEVRYVGWQADEEDAQAFREG